MKRLEIILVSAYQLIPRAMRQLYENQRREAINRDPMSQYGKEDFARACNLAYQTARRLVEEEEITRTDLDNLVAVVDALDRLGDVAGQKLLVDLNLTSPDRMRAYLLSISAD